jgi:Protein of unknown function (DUF4058)
MPSPFPGMNPYLEHEDAWHNFHEQFPDRVVEVLEPQVGPNYFLKVDEHVYIHELPDDQRRFLGRVDAALSTKTGQAKGQAAESAMATLAAPRRVLLPAVNKIGLSYVEIRDRRSRRLVTVIELLSPSNKRPGPDREQYEYKRAEILASSTHLVEIDLLRGGERMPFDEPVACDYCLLVSRSEMRRQAELWTIGLRDRLPPIPIPLLGNEVGPILDLQAILHHLYDTRGYGKFIYDTPPDPPLSPEDAAWARSLVPSLPS